VRNKRVRITPLYQLIKYLVGVVRFRALEEESFLR